MESKRLRYAMIGYIAMIVFTEILRIIVRAAALPGIESSDWLFSSFAQVVGMLGIPLLIVYLAERKKTSFPTLLGELGVRHSPKWWVYAACIAIGILAPVMSTGMNVIAQMIYGSIGMWIPPVDNPVSNSVGAMFVSIIMTAVLPALCEEGLHRGILTRGLTPHYKDRTVILITALMFSLMHTYAFQTIYTFVFGLVMGFLTVKTRSIWPAVTVHFVNNGMLTVGDYVRANRWFGVGLTDAIDRFTDTLFGNLAYAILFWVACIAAIIGLLVLIVRFGRRPVKHSETGAAGGITRGAMLDSSRTLTRALPLDAAFMALAIFAGAVFTLISFAQYLM